MESDWCEKPLGWTDLRRVADIPPSVIRPPYLLLQILADWNGCETMDSLRYTLLSAGPC